MMAALQNSTVRKTRPSVLFLVLIKIYSAKTGKFTTTTSCMTELTCVWRRQSVRWLKEHEKRWRQRPTVPNHWVPDSSRSGFQALILYFTTTTTTTTYYWPTTSLLLLLLLLLLLPPSIYLSKSEHFQTSPKSHKIRIFYVIIERLLTFLVQFSILVLNLPFLKVLPSTVISWNFTTRQSSRISILHFFQISKNMTFYVFWNDVSKSRKKSFAKVYNPQSLEMSSHTWLSDHCNSVPRSASVIHSEPLLNIECEWCQILTAVKRNNKH